MVIFVGAFVAVAEISNATAYYKKSALDGGATGMDFYEKIVEQVTVFSILETRTVQFVIEFFNRHNSSFLMFSI